MPKILLRELKAAAIVTAIADAAQRWSDADFPARVRVAAAIGTRLSYTEPVVDYALDRLFLSLRRDLLADAICDELGSLDVLDGPVTRNTGTRAYARGVDRVVIVSSDTTIGVAIVPAVYALCAKCTVVVKDRGDALVAAFFESLIDERSEFRAAAVAQAWTGGDDPREAATLGQADVVVAFGGNDALRAIRERVRPDARFIGHGHCASIGYVDLVDLAPAQLAAVVTGIATDALVYDGDGCMSVHALFVAADEAARQPFLTQLNAAFERVSVEFPAGAIDPRRAAAAAAYRNIGIFRAAAGRGALLAPAKQTAAIAVDPPRDTPPPFLPRTLPVFWVPGHDDVASFVNAHKLPIEAIGVVDTHAPDALVLAQRLGAVRLTRLGEMQSPPVSAHHGGAARITDFVRWIDCE